MAKYSIRYPSGRTFTLRGELRVLGPYPGSRLMNPVVVVGGEAHLLDPRAVVRDERDTVVFAGCSSAQLEADLARRVRQE